jgi:hypothetical protein
VRDHARQLVEKRLRKPFFEAAYAAGAERLAPAELQTAMRWIDERFRLIRCDDDELPSVDWVLERARAAVLRYGIRGLVIDPYNELDHRRPKTMSETEYVSKMLTKVKRFAQARSAAAAGAWRLAPGGWRPLPLRCFFHAAPFLPLLFLRLFACRCRRRCGKLARRRLLNATSKKQPPKPH